MNPIRIIAIPTASVEKVRVTGKSPGYGHPANTEIAVGYGPCRHCLRTFNLGEDKRTLFTYDPFHGLENIPLPGPIFIHAGSCARYLEHGGYPEQMKRYPTTLAAYAKGRRLIAEVQVDDRTQITCLLMSLTFTFATEPRDAVTFEWSTCCENRRAEDRPAVRSLEVSRWSATHCCST